MVETFHRQTYLDQMAADIRDVGAREDIADYFAAGRVIAEHLGYDLDEVEFVDGAGDRGIDFWYASDAGLYVYQVKMHQMTDRSQFNLSKPFDNGGVVDLIRARNFLLNGRIVEDDHRLASLKDTFSRIIRNHRSQETDAPINVYLNLVILGDRLTDSAFDEMADFEKSLSAVDSVEEVPVRFHIDFQNIDDILNTAWREENRDWVDIHGKKRDIVQLEPMRQSNKLNYLNDNKSAIFYCRAFDLVQAYEVK